ncbi:MAG: response regulator [Desulfomicrobium sp.]|nr:response regulator [Pseudomonadota bacterium]MBV1711605.1 response regulator [Desulfomicrobium sp.]MBU4569669.1 response regulator [Pseudomonadota bacterium]MBU4595389.1 response regulator [Pseudomonadota bacterium]MBV1718680.1 response regulator [Desulfomicrobium sp.]
MGSVMSDRLSHACAGCVTCRAVFALLAGMMLFHVWISSAFAAEVCLLGDQGDEYDLRPYMEYLEDKEKTLTIEQVASARMAPQFGTPQGGHFNFGFRQSALWFRFTIQEQSAASGGSGLSRYWILDPGWNLYATIQLFVPDSNSPGGWLTYSAGHLLSVSGDQERRHFRLPAGLTAPTTCYLRVTGIRALVLSPHITTIDRAIWINDVKVLGTGLLVGFFITMVLIHLAICLYTGNGKFRWLVLGNLAFAGFVALTSYQHLFSIRDMPAAIMMVGLMVQGFFGSVIRAFLELRKYNRRIDAILRFCIYLIFAVAACAFFLPEELQGNFSMNAAMPVSVIGALACIVSLKRDRFVSMIFLVAWIGAVASVFIYNRAAHGAFAFAHPMILWCGFVVEGISMAVLLAYTVQAMALQRQSAEALAQAKSTFLASMSHEIRTPMTAILGFLNLSLQMGAEGQLRQYLLKIRTSAQHLMGIINDILDLAKIEADKVELETKPFEVESVLRDSADILVPRAFENGNELVVSVQPGLPRDVVGDSLRLKQILVNLGGNAIKFTRNGTVRLAVLRAEDGQSPEDAVTLRFQVSDTGIGIDAAVLPRLFESYVQADASTARVYGGTGLGLNISRRLVHLMGGEITVRSQLGQGSTFEFTAVFKPEGLATEPAPAVEQADLKVLVAEDNPASREAMEEVVACLGLKGTFAGSAAEALRLASAEDFDLILLDWDLPDMTGPEAVPLLRSSERLARVPVALMTSPARPEVESIEPGRLGVEGLLAKPFTASSVQDMLRRVIYHDDSSARELGGIAAEEQRNRERARGLRVLLAEDNRINQELICLILSQAGVLVEVANNGVEAVLRVMDASRPALDVVLMDVHMPEMDGYEATRTIRRDPRFHVLPVIALTTNVMAGGRERCLAAGMNDHLGKPVDTGALFAALVKWAAQSS